MENNIYENYEPLYDREVWVRVEDGKLVEVFAYEPTDTTNFRRAAMSAVFANTYEDVPVYRGPWEGALVGSHETFDDLEWDRFVPDGSAVQTYDQHVFLAGELWCVYPDCGDDVPYILYAADSQERIEAWKKKRQAEGYFLSDEYICWTSVRVVVGDKAFDGNWDKAPWKRATPFVMYKDLKSKGVYYDHPNGARVPHCGDDRERSDRLIKPVLFSPGETPHGCRYFCRDVIPHYVTTDTSEYPDELDPTDTFRVESFDIKEFEP